MGTLLKTGLLKLRINNCLQVIIILFFILSSGTSFPQGTPPEDLVGAENMMKYWQYRYRFLGDDEIPLQFPGFIQIGEGAPGLSIPASTRDGCNKNLWVFDLGGECENQNIAGTGLMGYIYWGDATIDMGNYLALLATEWKLLFLYGQNTSNTETEIHFALHALQRLDFFGEEVFSSAGEINGYLARDDVPADFNEFFSDEFQTVNSSRSCWEPTTVPFSPPPGACEHGLSNPSFPFGNTMSQDQAIGILFGLRFITELIPTGIIVNGSDLKAEAQGIATDIITYIRDGAGQCGYTPLTSITQLGTNSILNIMFNAGFPVGLDFNAPLPVTFTIVDPVNCEPVCRGPLAHAFSYPIAATGYQITGNNFQNVFSLTHGLPIWQLAVKPATQLIPDQLTYNQNMILKLAVSSNTWSAQDVYDAAVVSGKEMYDLANAVLNNSAPLTQKIYWDNLFLSAPCNGTCFDDYDCVNLCDDPCTTDMSCHCAESNNLQWRYQYRWDNQYICSNFWGEFPGIDYMLAYNLYRLAFIDQISYPAYFSLIDRQVDDDYPMTLQPDLGIPITIGNDQLPISVQAVSTLTSNSTLSADAHVTFYAQKEIILGPEFDAPVGAEFETIHDFTCIPAFFDLGGVTIVAFKEGGSDSIHRDIGNNTYSMIDSTGNLTYQNNTFKKSVKTEEMKSYFNISPNPSYNGFFTITNTFSTVNITVTDILGRTVLQSAISNPQSAIDLSSSPPGIYFVKVITDEGIFVKKVVLQY